MRKLHLITYWHTSSNRRNPLYVRSLCHSPLFDDCQSKDLIWSIVGRSGCDRPRQSQSFEGEEFFQTHDLPILSFPQIHALIVENTFTSLPGVVRDWPIIGSLSFLCHQKWNSLSKLRLIPTTVPILMLSGEQDVVVRPHHMLSLWNVASKRGEKKKGKDTAPAAPPTKDVFSSFEHGSHGER